jgi:hypothetical protein
MRRLILRIIAFVIMLIGMVYAIMAMFRSQIPMYWIIIAIICIVVLVIFPYKSFFNIKKSK